MQLLLASGTRRLPLQKASPIQSPVQQGEAKTLIELLVSMLTDLLLPIASSLPNEYSPILVSVPVQVEVRMAAPFCPEEDKREGVAVAMGKPGLVSFRGSANAFANA